jgi:hypothetical protein
MTAPRSSSLAIASEENAPKDDPDDGAEASAGWLEPHGDGEHCVDRAQPMCKIMQVNWYDNQH